MLPSGALIAIDRHERDIIGLIELGRRSSARLVTVAAVVGQVWRNGARQARLSRALSTIDVRPVAIADAKAAGELLAKANTSDVVDALLALAAHPGDQLLTSDPGDMRTLLGARGITVTVVAV